MTFAGRETERRGLCSSGCYAPRGRALKSKSVLVATHAVFLALLLLCSHSWADCVPFTRGSVEIDGRYVGISYCSPYNQNYLPSKICEATGGFWTTTYNGRTCYVSVGTSSSCSSDYSTNCAPSSGICCRTQAELDTAKCSVNPTAEGCVEEDVPSSCEQDYYTCMRLKGQWKKISSTATSCASECNTCGSAEVAFRNNQINVCCNKGLAPPDSAVQCYFPAERGPGMTWSVRADKHNEEAYSCGELSTADGEAIQENQERFYRFCEQGERYEEQPDTNEAPGGGSSSSGGGESSESGSHSWANEVEALGGLYGVLDTIRDTLTKRLTPATETIRDCLLNWTTCTGITGEVTIDASSFPVDSSALRIDTTLKRLIRPLMDSSVKIDSAQLKVLKQLDSLYKRGLVNDTDIVQAVNAIKGDINDVESAVKGVKHGIDSLIDSMTTYMDKVGQGIGAVGDSVGALRGDFNGFLEGEGTVPGDTTWDGYSDVYEDGSDSVANSYLTGLGGQLDSALNDTAFDRIFAPGGGTSGPADSARLPTIDSMQRVLDSSIVAQRSELEDTLHAAFDSLKDEFMLLDYDSLILAPLGVRVPNTNTCPEHCFTFDISGENSNQNWLGDLGTLDFGFCRNLPGLGFDVFFLIRIIGRLFTAMFCIYIGLWFIAGRKN